MTQDEIIRTALEAGFDVAQWASNGGLEVVIYEEGPITIELERFFNLAFAAGAAHEREACAKVCEELINEDTCYVWIPDAKGAVNNCAAAIRARGEK